MTERRTFILGIAIGIATTIGGCQWTLGNRAGWAHDHIVRALLKTECSGYETVVFNDSGALLYLTQLGGQTWTVPSRGGMCVTPVKAQAAK